MPGLWAKTAARDGAVQASAPASKLSRFVYVADQAADSVAEFHIGAQGALIAIGTIATGKTPQLIRSDPTGPYVYVLNHKVFASPPSSISEYRIGAHGRLQGIGTVTGLSGNCMIVGPKGRRVYVGGSGKLREYVIGPRGALTRVAAAPIMADINSLVLDPAGRYLFGDDWKDSNSQKIYEYALGPHGEARQIGAYLTGGQTEMRVDPAAPYLYVGNTLWGRHGAVSRISEYRIGPEGRLSLQGVMPLKSEPLSMAVGEMHRHLYVGLGNDMLAQYAIGAGGTLAPMGSEPTENLPRAIAVGRQRDVYVVNGVSATVSQYIISQGGALVAPGVAVTLREDGPLTVDPADPRYLYVVQHGTPPPQSTTPLIIEYALRPSGVLRRKPGAVATLSSSPIEIPRGGHYAYQQRRLDGSILAYSIGAHGRLRAMGPVSSAGPETVLLIADPAGPYLYQLTSNGIAAYAVRRDGHLREIGRSPLRYEFNDLVMGPTGRHLYVAGSRFSREYRIGRHGRIAYFKTVQFAKGTLPPFVIGPRGRYAYSPGLYKDPLTRSLDDYLTEYAIKADGRFAVIGHLITELSLSLLPLQIDPVRPYAFFNSYGRIAEYKITKRGTLGAADRPVPGLYDISAMTVDPAGKHLYAARYVTPWG